jgi:hypothetical protein
VTAVDPDTALRSGIEKYRAKAYGEALPLLLNAANAGKMSAAFYLGYMYDQGLGVAQDYSTARRWYEQAAAAGDEVALNNLAVMYGTGHGVPVNVRTALQLYRRSAAAGYATAFYNIARYYEDGRGVTADKATAIAWYKKAAVRGDANALQQLERFGETDAVTWAKADPAEALRVGLDRYNRNQRAEAFNPLLRAVASGKTEAALQLGYLYSHGLGTSVDYEDARFWYEKAAATGDLVAMNNLGTLYTNGNGVPSDFKIALDWYRKAAAGAYPSAFFNIGLSYERGEGVTLDKAAAVGWYKKAATRGDASALQALERLGETDAVTWAKADPDEALKVGIDRYKGNQSAESFNPLLRAGAAGKSDAAFELGYLYAHGLGTPVEYDDARLWYEKAAATGDTMAMNNLGVLYDNGNGVPQDHRKAFEWFRKAAASGLPLAMRNIGLLYEGGQGVAASRADALNWYRRAAQLKLDSAAQALARLGEPLDGPAKTTTGALGSFSVPVNPGTYRVSVERAGVKSVEREVKVAELTSGVNPNILLTVGAAPEDFTCEVRSSLPGGWPDAIAGNVRDKAGAGLSGVIVSVRRVQ